MKRQAILAAVPLIAILAACGQPASQPPKEVSVEALELKNLGLAQLENEDPAAAAETYRQLAELVPGDPLAHANLAIATLRQQKTEEAEAAIGRALELAPERADLLAIKGDVLQWSGRGEEALAAYEAAARAEPDDPEMVYSLYRQTTNLETEAAAAAQAWALERLAELRPENTVVLLAQGKQAIAEGDRTGATGAFLRIEELLWQAPPVAERAMEGVREALEGPDLEAARVPAQRLENVLKVTPMYREGLRELMTGIQGIPVAAFAAEPPPSRFGPPVEVSFTAESLSDAATAGRGLATGDLDGDGTADVARLVTAEGGTTLEIRLSSGGEATTLEAPAGLGGLLPTDLDNDGTLDLLAYGPGGLVYWKGDGAGAFAEATADFGLQGQSATAAVAVDYDIEGDLDLALAGQAGADLLRNSLQGALEAVGDRSLPQAVGAGATDLVASDLDRDGDLDLALATAVGIVFLENLRQGELRDASADAGLGGSSATALVSADLDNDGWPELVAASGEGVFVYRNRQGSFQRDDALAPGPVSAVVAFDADNDGRLDLAAGGEGGASAWLQRDEGFTEVKLTDTAVTALAATDLDGDGDLDLLAGGPGGLTRLTNEGGNANRWLQVRLRGIDEGNSKNNILGLGATAEVFAGDAYQFREATGDVIHFGLGRITEKPLLRVMWTNGVPQNRIGVEGEQRIVETQVLKGSCPFLYTWDGEKIAFVTDLLWGAPLGMPVAEGVWAGADPTELVRVDGAAVRDGHYDLRITEELWEAAFFDYVRLWVVDHPREVEVASSLKILLGQQVKDEIHGSRDLKRPEVAWDGLGRRVTDAVAQRDEVYADGYLESPYQGIAARPWAFSFALDEAPGQAIRLHLDGWIFPADASLNLAAAQRSDLSWDPPRLEMEIPFDGEDGEGEDGLYRPTGNWQVLMPVMGFPAGKTKTMVIDTPPLPEGVRRLRIVTTQWLSWDRIAWTTQIADEEPQAVARLEPAKAELRVRGYSGMERRAPNGPHVYDYARVSTKSPWEVFPGSYTRLGDVRELLDSPDDRSVILAPGDEILLTFDARDLPPIKDGWQRTVFLESHGWDKDADRNTYEANQMEPLPFRAMSGYPYGPDEAFPDTPLHRAYREEWLTRRIEAPVGPDSNPTVAEEPAGTK